MAMHAHICNKCLEAGKRIVWVHGDECKGIETAHKCPECSTLSWKKFLVEPHQLPQQNAHAQPSNALHNAFNIFYVLVICGCLAYFIYNYYVKKTQGAPTP